MILYLPFLCGDNITKAFGRFLYYDKTFLISFISKNVVIDNILDYRYIEYILVECQSVLHDEFYGMLSMIVWEQKRRKQ